MIKTIIEVEGMQCSMCEAHINDAVRRAFPTVKKVSSSHSKGRTEILSPEALDEEALKKAIAATGYIPGRIRTEDAGEKKKFSLFGKK